MDRFEVLPTGSLQGALGAWVKRMGMGAWVPVEIITAG